MAARSRRSPAGRVTGRPKGRVPEYLASYKMKPTRFPEGFVLVVDTREQESPLLKRMPKGLVMKSDTLKNGDYSILGFEDVFAIERKGISDLWSYCGSERDKTVEKMRRFRDMEWVGLVIEARESDIICPQPWSKMSPESVRQALVSFDVRYGVHIYYNDDRDQVARWLMDRAVKFYEIKKEC